MKKHRGAISSSGSVLPSARPKHALCYSERAAPRLLSKMPRRPRQLLWLPSQAEPPVPFLGSPRLGRLLGPLCLFGALLASRRPPRLGSFAGPRSVVGRGGGSPPAAPLRRRRPVDCFFSAVPPSCAYLAAAAPPPWPSALRRLTAAAPPSPPSLPRSASLPPQASLGARTALAALLMSMCLPLCASVHQKFRFSVISYLILYTTEGSYPSSIWRLPSRRWHMTFSFTEDPLFC